MLDRLVAMCIITHIHHLHFTDFMNCISIVTVVEDRRQDKDRVEHLIESILATHQLDQSLRIVEYRPGIMPGITLCKGIAPLQRIERRHELAILQPSSHQLRFLIKYLLIIHRTLGKRLQLLSRLTQSLTQLIDTPVIVSIFQGTGYTLIDLHIVWHITQLVVILVSQTSGRVYLRMNSLSTMHHCLPKRLHIIATQTGKIGIGHYRSRIVTHHTATMTRACPLWQEATLLISISKTFLNLHVF